MKVDITLRDLNAEEAAAILVAAKEGGAKLALFLATPGQPAATAAPAAVAAATGQVAPDPTPPLPPPGGAPAEAPAQTAGDSPEGAKPGAAAAAFFRAPNVKAVVKILVDAGMKDAAEVLARTQVLREQGVPALAAVPPDQLGNRIAAAMAALGV